MGKYPGRSGDYHPYCKPSKKRKVRRNLKRRDKASVSKQLRKEETGDVDAQHAKPTQANAASVARGVE